jgi:hypothetical protein
MDQNKSILNRFYVLGGFNPFPYGEPWLGWDLENITALAMLSCDLNATHELGHKCRMPRAAL